MQCNVNVLHSKSYFIKSMQDDKKKCTQSVTNKSTSMQKMLRVNVRLFLCNLVKVELILTTLEARV